MLDLCLNDYLVIARAAQDFAPMMEYYEAWAEAEKVERQLVEDQKLALGLQRALKRSRSCSPTSPAEVQSDRLPPVPGEVEDRDSCTTESPSVVIDDAEGGEGHEEAQQLADREEQQEQREKTATPNEELVRNSAAYEDWYSLSKHFVFAVMTVAGPESLNFELQR